MAGDATAHDDPIVRSPVKMAEGTPLNVRMVHSLPQGPHGTILDSLAGHLFSQTRAQDLDLGKGNASGLLGRMPGNGWHSCHEQTALIYRIGFGGDNSGKLRLKHRYRPGRFHLFQTGSVCASGSTARALCATGRSPTRSCTQPELCGLHKADSLPGCNTAGSLQPAR